jgi:hydroxyethylthiazole kinase-like uncharacterized protein yjeF
MKVVTVEEMRQLEERSVGAGVSLDSLMEAAGLGVARRIGQLLNGPRGKRVLVLVGPGNNGGDGLVAARYLSDWGALVTLYMTSPKRGCDDKYEECRSRRIRILEADDGGDHFSLESYLSLTDVVLDAMFGIGQRFPLEGSFADVCHTLKKARRQQPSPMLIALDVPTGVDAETGAVDDACQSVDITLTLGVPKAGLFKFPAAAHTGLLETIDIGIPVGLDSDISLALADDAMINGMLPPRSAGGHKGSFGHVVVVGGSRSYVGAPVLAATGAYRSGAGLVTLATPASVYRMAALHIAEAVQLPLDEATNGQVALAAASSVRLAIAAAKTVVIGPGLGQSDEVQEFVKQVLLVEPALGCPAVIDADALNALAKTHTWWERLQTSAVLTPHPGEMSRLLHRGVDGIEEDRVAAAREAAAQTGQVVVLKGAYTVIAAPDGRICLSPFANPALASGGTGDVLAGVIGGLLAQGCERYEAAVTGVYIHGMAGEGVVDDLGSAGLLASDLLLEIPRAMQALRAG